MALSKVAARIVLGIWSVTLIKKKREGERMITS